MNSKTLFDQIVRRLALMETSEEVRAIVFLLMENVFDLNQTEILTGKEIEVSEVHSLELDSIIRRLNSNEPIQYILGVADFFGRKFIVNRNVLIPRQETEELVQAILKYHHLHPVHEKPYLDYGNHRKHHKPTFRILDIGTGSGCIPITLKLEMPDTAVFATDISEEAIAVAKQNASALNSNVSIIKHDILTDPIEETELDVIVSNPPYIMESEKDSLKQNVIDFEPHGALFVPANDPLLFYRVIAEKSSIVLKPNGKLIVEVNEKFAAEVAKLFKSAGYHDEQVIMDLNKKPRIVTATK